MAGVVLHTLIIYACLLVMSWPYLGNPVLWVLLTLIAVTHFFQDWGKIKFTQESKHNFLLFILDQVLHVTFLASIFFTDLKETVPPLNPDRNPFITFYNSDFICLYLTAVIISSYMGYYVIVLFKQDFMKINRPVQGFERRHGFYERFVITSAVMAKELSPLLILFILILRPLFVRIPNIKEKTGLPDEFGSWTEILLTGGYSVLIGMIFRAFI